MASAVKFHLVRVVSAPSERPAFETSVGFGWLKTESTAFQAN